MSVNKTSLKKKRIKIESGEPCRLCAKIKSDISIDVLSKDNRSLPWKIQQLLSVSIQSWDKYHKICTECFTKLQSCHEFYEEVQRAQVLLEERIVSVDTVEAISQIKVEPDINIQVENEESTPVKKSKRKISKTTNKEDSSSGKLSIKEQTDQLNQFYKFLCFECKVDLETYEKYYTHMTITHELENPEITCCDTNIPCLRIKLLEHFLLHERPDELQCRECGKQFMNKRAQRRHEKTHNRNLPCPHCEKMFFSKQILELHITNLHTPDDLRQKFQCDVCQLKTTTKYSILHHLIAKHKFVVDHPLAKPEEMLCPHCARSFLNRSTFDTHILTKHKIIMTNCPQCGKEVNKKLLASHIRRMHDTVQVSCPHCQKVFRNKHVLREHTFSVHIPPIHVCDICGRKFKTKDKMKDHRLTHFVENRFHCDVCPVTANDYANILKHRKQVHPNAEPIPYGMGRKILDSTYEAKN